MRKIKEVLRLKASGVSDRQIAICCGISRTTVSNYLRRSEQAGVFWPIPLEWSEQELESRLFPTGPSLSGTDRAKPDWPVIHRELKHKSVTLFLLWQEYRSIHNQGYQYSWFCDWEFGVRVKITRHWFASDICYSDRDLLE